MQDTKAFAFTLKLIDGKTLSVYELLRGKISNQVILLAFDHIAQRTLSAEQADNVAYNVQLLIRVKTTSLPAPINSGFIDE